MNLDYISERQMIEMQQNPSPTLYHIFNVVAEAGSISKAAEELFISQPAISKAIGRLESSLDTKLFHRSSRGVSLTDAGKLLYQYTSAAFLQLSEGEEHLRLSRQLGVGHIRIGVSATLCKYILLPCLKEFTERFPHIRISIQCQSTFQTITLLQNHQVDIGLVGRPSHLDSLCFHSIGEIEDIFVATPSYLKNLLEREPLATSSFPTTTVEKMTSEQLFSHANLMLLDKENISRHYIDDYFRSCNIQTGAILEVSSMDLLIEFARIGLGIACVIKEFVQESLRSGKLVCLPLSVPIKKREIGFSYLKNQAQSDSMQKFLTFCVEERNF